MSEITFKAASRLDLTELSSKLDSSTTVGLSKNKASELLAYYGVNKIKAQEVTAWDIFKRQFKSPFVYLLLAAGVLSFFLGERIDASMIALFVLINASLGFYQEYRSEQTVKLLRKYLAKRIRVIRDGKEENIDVSLLVPGDLVVFEPGDIIPADVRFTQDYNLTVDETVLTGESAPVTKSSKPQSEEAHDIYTAHNIGFSGTTISSGHGRGIVIATGQESAYAKIVKLAGETVKESSFDKEIGKFSSFTLWVVLATLTFIIVTSIAVKESPSLTDLIIFSIALAVSVIPEALPVVTTFSLSIGASNLVKKSVIVKRLTSVEDLGALQVLATDKTGTLTENKLEVDEIKAKDPSSALTFFTLASYFTDTSRNLGNNAFDVALKNKMSSKDIEELKNYKKIAEIPFDPDRKRVTTLVSDKEHLYLISRGSPEAIFALCKGTTESNNLKKWVISKGRSGKRSLAVSVRQLSLKNKVLGKDISKLEVDMDFVGLISFIDPIKKSTYTAVTKAKSLGVSVKIITGDSPEVAGQVAYEVGLIDDPEKVITGSDFEKLDVESKHSVVSEYNVFARILPAQKHEIVSLLKEKYYTGFLGEGINDAPALKASNVAVVVESASDVAKEASDIVLLKKDLGVIIDGVEEGRRVFANTSKYITATMASNFGNFFAVALIAPFINFLPMLPLQILLVNLLSDFPMIMVATDTVDPEVVKTPKRYNLRGFATQALSYGFISTAFDFIVFSSFVGKGEAHLQTYWFIESILSELLFLFTIRSSKPIWKSNLPSKPLMYLTAFTITTTFVVPFTSWGDKLFGFVRPELGHSIVIVSIVVAYLLSNEAVKSIINRYTLKQEARN